MGTPAEEFGPYVVYEQIGLGGMATVHRAETQGIAGFSKQVALKRMLPSVAADASLVKSFIREARLASHLRHANVAQTYDLGKVGDTYFIAMELVPGRNLREVLKHCSAVVGPMPLPIALNIINQICDALDYAHDLCDETGQPLGIIHRDVSPSNIIVSEGGVVKLIDFGIAKASGRSGMGTMSGTIKGKFGYMAPEYLMGSIDARADLFALGVISHELLANRPLFQGKDDMDTLYRVKDMPILPPSRINPLVPPELDSVIMTALDRNPEHRWQRANAMRQALTTEIKRLNMVAHDSQVLEWIEWAFHQTKDTRSQFDVDSEPMISITSGTSQMPMPMPASKQRGSGTVPDDFLSSDGMQTLIKPSGSKPLQAQDAGNARPDDWNVATDPTAPASDALERPIGGMNRDHGEWKAGTDAPTKLVRKSTPVAAQPDPRLSDARRPGARPSSPHVVQRNTPAPTRNTPVPTRNTPPPSASMSARQAAQRSDQERTFNDPLEARFDQLDEDDIATDDRPGRPDTVPMTNAQARTLMIEPPRVAPLVPYVAPPVATTPVQMRTLAGAGVATAPSTAASPAANQVGRIPAANASSGERRIDDLDARAERPSAGRLTPNPSQGSVVRTKVEPAARRGASNFLLALLVLIAAGGAAAVVYFALPYLT